MPLNDYEYVNQARSVASSLSNIRDLLTDEVPDQQQIIQYLAEISAAINPIQSVLSAEQLTEFEVKFAAVTGLIFLAREARKLDDGKFKDNLLQLAATGQALLEINIPDEPNA